MFDIPDAQVVMRELAPVLEHVQGALECGTLEARAYFDSLHLPPDVDLAPSIVRFHAKRTLDMTRQNGAEGINSAYSLRKIPGNGLLLKADVYKLRVLKVSPIVDGKIPAPGHSITRQHFWNANRQLILDLEFPSNVIPLPALNLIVLWETDAHYNLSKLYLVCPKSGGKRIDSARAYWIEEIDRFGLAALDSGQNQTTPDSDNDVDITRPDMSETGTEDSSDE